jgi:hypothetical protein
VHIGCNKYFTDGQSYNYKGFVTFIYKDVQYTLIFLRGRRGRDRMVVGFTTTCTISAYHH